MCHVYSPPLFVLLCVSVTGHLAVNSTRELRKLTTNCRVRIVIFHFFIIVPVFTFVVNYFMYFICAVPILLCQDVNNKKLIVLNYCAELFSLFLFFDV